MLIMTTLAILLALAGGYLLGSIPFGLVLTRAFGLGDIRKIGSGNIGATNVLRTGNKGLAAATLLLDALKGTIAVLFGMALAASLGGEFAYIEVSPGSPLPYPNTLPPGLGYVVPLALGGMPAGLGAFLGHLFPVWLRFKGGKGVATYIGVVFGLMWPVALVVCGVWLLVAWLTRYSSAASLAGAVVAPPAALLLGGGSVMGLALAVMSALLIWKHRENMARLRAGTESRIGQKG